MSPTRTSPEIAVVDIDLDEVIGRIAIKEIPDQIVVSGTHAKLIASHLDARSVTVFDLRSMAIEAVLDLGLRAEQLALDSAGRTFAVSGSSDDQVSVISLKPVEEMFRLSGIRQPRAGSCSAGIPGCCTSPAAARHTWR